MNNNLLVDELKPIKKDETKKIYNLGQRVALRNQATSPLNKNEFFQSDSNSLTSQDINGGDPCTFSGIDTTNEIISLSDDLQIYIYYKEILFCKNGKILQDIKIK